MHEPEHFSPQPGLFARESRRRGVPCCADVLAGESSANNVNCADAIGSDFPNVPEDGDAWPAEGKPFTMARFDLAHADDSHPGTLKPEFKAADSAEDSKDTKHL